MQYDIDKFNEYFADHPDDISIDDIDMARIPRHISCIMDGNGRWATARGLGRGEGHKAGIVSLQEVITACVRMGVDVLSAYAFSTENWNRPQAEVNLLMHLFAKTFVDELPLLKRENVRVEFLGDISALPKKTRDVFEYCLAETRDHTGMTLSLIHIAPARCSDRWARSSPRGTLSIGGIGLWTEITDAPRERQTLSPAIRAQARSSSSR